MPCLASSLVLVCLPQAALNLFVSKMSFRLGGEPAIYVLPNALENAWVAPSGEGMVLSTRRYGDVMPTVAGIGRGGHCECRYWLSVKTCC